MRLKHLLCSIFLLALFSCSQKKLIFNIDNLKEQDIKIYCNQKGFPELQKDSFDNFLVFVDSTNIQYTSTDFSKIKDCRDVYCFRNYGNKCFYEEYEIQKLGYNVNSYSSFTVTDNTAKNKYSNSYFGILFEKIK